MKRITTVLKESEAMAVRKAVCVAGGERVVITPMPQRLLPSTRRNGTASSLPHEKDVHVRLEVTADDSHSGSIVSAIQRIAHAGKIVLASRDDRLHRCAAQI